VRFPKVLLALTLAFVLSTGTAFASVTQDAETSEFGKYCPVCVMDGEALKEGSPQFTTTYEGKMYSFLGAEQLEAFLEDPDKYTGEDAIEAFHVLKKASKKEGSHKHEDAHHEGSH